MLKKEHINEDITLFKRSAPNKTKSFYFKEDVDSLLLQVNIRGNSKHNSCICEYSGESISGYTYLDIINKYEGVDSYKNKQSVSLHIKKDYLYKLLPQDKFSEDIFSFFQSNKSGKNVSNKKTNFKTQILAREIFDSPYNSTLDKLYIESKALELIHNEFNLLFTPKQTYENIVKLSSVDKEAIYHAKEILKKRIHNPPSIAELSKNVAINELKLKTGFHKFFNETPYNISLEYRLQEAKRLLEKSEYNVKEISKLVGYRYSQSFSTAFIKRFGIAPKELMKTRKYYY